MSNPPTFAKAFGVAAGKQETITSLRGSDKIDVVRVLPTDEFEVDRATGKMLNTLLGLMGGFEVVGSVG